MHPSASSPSHPAERFERIAVWLVAWGLLWWLLTEGQMHSWAIGVPTIVASTFLSQRLAPAAAWHGNVWGWLQFLPLERISQTLESDLAVGLWIGILAVLLFSLLH